MTYCKIKKLNCAFKAKQCKNYNKLRGTGGMAWTLTVMAALFLAVPQGLGILGFCP